MTNKTSMFKLGLFVLAGFLLLAGALIWVGSSDQVDGSQYVTYFAESVQGLQVGSQVKYQGINVGRVTALEVAPDPYLIEVVFTVKAEKSLANLVMAGLGIVGITGMSYIELVPQDAVTVAKSPKIDFPTPYPMIPSYSRGIQQVINSVSITMENLSRVDFEGLSNKSEALLVALQQAIDNPQLQEMVETLHASSKNIKVFTDEMQRLVGGTGRDRLVDRINETVKTSQDMAQTLKEQVEKMRLDKLGENVGQYVAELGDALDQLTRNLMVVSERLMRTSENLDRLVQRLEHSPSDVIFSEPVKPLPQEQIN